MVFCVGEHMNDYLLAKLSPKLQLQLVDIARYEARISENSKIEELIFWDNWNFGNIQNNDDLTTNTYDTLRTNLETPMKSVKLGHRKNIHKSTSDTYK